MHVTAAPPLVLTIVYWLHMLATVVWIGGLAAITLMVLPAAQRSLDAKGYSALLSNLVDRVQQLGWFCLAVLIVTGMFQMSSNPNYTGFLAITNNWAVAILTKHLVIGLMIVVSGYITWGLLPQMKRAALMRAAGRSVDEAKTSAMERREVWMLRLNLVLSVIVLLLTAWARSAG